MIDWETCWLIDSGSCTLWIRLMNIKIKTHTHREREREREREQYKRRVHREKKLVSSRCDSWDFNLGEAESKSCLKVVFFLAPPMEAELATTP